MMATVHQFVPAPSANRSGAASRQVRAFKPARHIRSGLNAALCCLAWLETHDFTPRHVVIDTDLAYPIITIEYGPECQQLKENHAAYSYGYAPLGGKREALWRTEMFGCRIEWSERGH